MIVRRFAALLLTATFASPVFAAPQVYQFDKAPTNIIFFINHLGFSNKFGEFRTFDDTLRFDPDNISASSVQVSLPELGRASCRARVCQYGKISVVAVSLKRIYLSSHRQTI